LNVAEIEVTSYGTDPVGAVRAGMEPLLEQGSDAVYLTLDLEDPETGALLPAFESAGFLFAGILPHGASGKTALILQYLNHLRLDLGAIHPAGGLAQELLAHIAASKGRVRPGG
jgi:serine/threonine-protein kinase RsbW